MKTSDFDYELPERLIAQTPLKDRTSSRLMVLDRSTKTIEHKHFYDIVDMLDSNDVLVLNDTKVLPARLYGNKVDTDAFIEVLLLKDLGNNEKERLSKTINDFRVDVIGSNDYVNAQVCTGGVPLSEIDEKTMESKIVPNMYITGEALDVDGICGGYNMSFAFITGLLISSRSPFPINSYLRLVAKLTSLIFFFKIDSSLLTSISTSYTIRTSLLASIDSRMIFNFFISSF